MSRSSDYNNQFPATHFLVQEGVLARSPFTLIDIGCSGGIGKYWRVFGDRLRAYAIDPMLAEIATLRAAETNPNVTYHAGYIGLAKDHPVVQSRGGAETVGNNPWRRLSTAWAMEIAAKASDDNETKVRHNRWPETRLADPSTLMTLPAFVSKHQIDNVDFIKLDIDGNDFYALLSCEEMIKSCGVIGFMLEVNYSGTDCETDHTFHNTDRFMRRHGFELIDLTIRRYSRRALPAPFAIHMFAQTQWGAPLQGDAVYLKSMVQPDGAPALGEVSPIKLLKAVAICEILGLPDCAAELLTAHRQQLAAHIEVDEMLDLLTPKFNGRKLSYNEYLRIFAENPEAFFPATKSNHKSKATWTNRLRNHLKSFAARIN